MKPFSDNPSQDRQPACKHIFTRHYRNHIARRSRIWVNADARPLAEALIITRFSVWFDEYELKIGDSLREKIDEGLANARYGIIILSKNFFSLKKQWTRRELDGLTAREDADGKKCILPVWYEITQQEVASYSPTLAGLVSLVAKDKSIDQMVVELAKVLRP